MRTSHFCLLSVVLFTSLLFLPGKAVSQIIKPAGITTEASSQLVYYYGTLGTSIIQVTNTNPTDGVWIHVQIFRSHDTDGTPGNGNEVYCDERDFVDFLTPNDTHVYIPSESDGLFKNNGETETEPGDAINIDLETPPSVGFIVITPVVSVSDLTAISFQHLIGSFLVSSEGIVKYTNAVGRDAVDFITGDVLPEGTPLDGVTGGFIVIQPSELSFEFLNDVPADVIGIVFQDAYGDPGLLGYQVLPGSASWTSFIFDFKEDPTSCGVRNIDCFLLVGLNNTLPQAAPLLTQNDLLCGGSSTPDGLGGDVAYGWTRVFVSGLGDFENLMGLFGEADAPPINTWMKAK